MAAGHTAPFAQGCGHQVDGFDAQRPDRFCLLRDHGLHQAAQARRLGNPVPKRDVVSRGDQLQDACLQITDRDSHSTQGCATGPIQAARSGKHVLDSQVVVSPGSAQVDGLGPDSLGVLAWIQGHATSVRSSRRIPHGRSAGTCRSVARPASDIPGLPGSPDPGPGWKGCRRRTGGWGCAS